jgi:coniferyl-aldehyde dehydrogenase
MGATVASDGVAALNRAYAHQRVAFARDGGLGVPARREALRALRASLARDAEAYAKAIAADFGARSRHETLLTEVALLLQGIDYTLPRLARWAAPTRMRLAWPFFPARAEIFRVPRGVAGIIGPSNYPLQLALMPAIGALAAGCRLLIKPSEMTPLTAALMREGLSSTIDPAVLAIVEGDATVAAAMTRLPLDALLFTGSKRVGRMVLEATVETLTPVILELGGKSPGILDRGADLARAAASVIAGKLLNAGQTCVAPDYLLVPRETMEPMIAALRAAAARLYPDTTDYSAILSKPAFARLRALEAGQDVVPLLAGPIASPRYPPAIIRAPRLDSAVMQEEIFGPLLPVVPYDTLDDALGVIRALPTPLTLYWFGDDRTRRDHMLARTASGSVSINETVLHAGIQALPFGGVGASGLGRYHGKPGFDAFTHERPVFHQARWTITTMMRPPYGKTAERILKGLLK